MIIGVTGNIGSGKSYVAGQLAMLLGAEICDADRMCRHYMQSGHEGWRAVRRKWGDRFILPDDEIDTATLREAIFADPRIREDLENILHPLVQVELERHINNCRHNHCFLVAEIPLLFEIGWQQMFDVVVTVYADRQQTIRRVVDRDGVSEAQVLKSLAAQMDINDKIRFSDYAVDNSGCRQATMRQLEEIKQALLNSPS